jgi:hypothetical protein
MAVAALAVAIILIFLLWKVPEWQTPSGITDLNQRALLQNELRRTIAQIALGLLVLGTLFVGWRRVRAADRTVEIASEQQITERFTRAIEQLGNEQSMAIRLGGIYALERIAKDSPRDHWQVMEVLTAFVRENARWEGETDENGVPVSEESDDHRVATDIQAILTVLGRRQITYDPLDKWINLTGTDLRYANFHNSRLGKVWLAMSHLQKAFFEGAFLEGADFSAANLEGAYLWDANLQGAKMRFCNLNEADLEGCILKNTDLAYARNITREQLDFALTDETTVFPAHLN